MKDFRQLMEGAVVLDLETTIGNKTHDPNVSTPSPFHANNYVVAAGFIRDVFKDTLIPAATLYNSETPIARINYRTIDRQLLGVLEDALYKPVLLVGHNIKFDLGHMIQACYFLGRSRENVQKMLGNVWLWDTMVAEFYLSNQASVSIGLEDLAQKMKVPFVKNATISESFKLGIGADKIDKETLLSYLRADVETTADIFKKQIEGVLRSGGPQQVEYLLRLMRAIVTTTQMEVNGITLNVDEMKDEGERIYKELSDVDDQLTLCMAPAFDTEAILTISPSSPTVLSTYLYGGEYKVRKQVQVLDEDGTPIRYKSGQKKGQIKTRGEETLVSIVGAIPPFLMTHPTVVAALSPKPSTDDKTLRTIIGVAKGFGVTPPSVSFMQKLLAYRALAKDYNTYYVGLLKHRNRFEAIHPNYNHAIARTKRLTSSGPNLQNVSNKGEK